MKGVPAVAGNACAAATRICRNCPRPNNWATEPNTRRRHGTVKKTGVRHGFSAITRDPLYQRVRNASLCDKRDPPSPAGDRPVVPVTTHCAVPRVRGFPAQDTSGTCSTAELHSPRGHREPPSRNGAPGVSVEAPCRGSASAAPERWVASLRSRSRYARCCRHVPIRMPAFGSVRGIRVRVRPSRTDFPD